MPNDRYCNLAGFPLTTHPASKQDHLTGYSANHQQGMY